MFSRFVENFHSWQNVEDMLKIFSFFFKYLKFYAILLLQFSENFENFFFLGVISPLTHRKNGILTVSYKIEIFSRFPYAF